MGKVVREHVWGKVENLVTDVISWMKSEVLNDSYCFHRLPT